MHDNPIPLTEENLPALMEKHQAKIDTAVGNDSEKQQKRLTLFEHDPDAMAAHYPELQKKSEELRERNLTVQKTAAAAGWAAFAATAMATGYQAAKGKISQSPLIKGIVVLLTSITAGFAGNFVTDRILGARIRDESKDVATASRIAYERELAPYMEDTEHKLATRNAIEARAALKAATPQQRDASFTAQAVAEKVAATETVAQR